MFSNKLMIDMSVNRMRKISLFFPVFVAISACSNSPSDSDVERALKNEVSNCSGLSVGDFSKINGIKINDVTHSVDVKYSISVLPLSGYADMQKNHQDKINKIQEEMSSFEPRLEEMRARNLYFINEKNRLNQQPMPPFMGGDRGQQTRDYYNEIGMQIQALDQEHEEYRRSIQNDPAQIKYDELNSAANKEISEYDDLSEKLIKQWRGSCKIGSKFISYVPTGDRNYVLNSITKGEKNMFNRKIVMIKTDNGWVEQD